jgi:LAO/AO transport system kinase
VPENREYFESSRQPPSVEVVHIWTLNPKNPNFFERLDEIREWTVKNDGKRLLSAAMEGDLPAFAKVLSWLEASSPKDALALKPLLEPEKAAFRLGITGPPGAGKSTLVSQLIGRLRALDLKVGVIAVDPSSPFTGGAILGDRIRYSDHSADAGVFIRSLGSRGSLGGLSASAYLMLRAFDVCGFDVVLVETVGVGQTEMDILHVADQVTVVLVPESGDSIQAMKAGLMEIADVFLVNKADRPGADALVREIKNAVHDGETGKHPEVYPVVATEGKGLEPFEKFVLENLKAGTSLENRSKPERLREEAKALLRLDWENKLKTKLAKVKKPSHLKDLF